MGADFYDEKYYEWQKKIGEFGGKANLFKFSKYITPVDVVLDFGCGGGFLLQEIQTCGERIGVELNDTARADAESKGVNCYKYLEDVPDASVDIVISNHALEHVDNPVGIILQMKRVVRTHGKIVIVVPHETNDDVISNDINMHLYTWAPQNIYNLMKFCGLSVQSAERIRHRWVPYYMSIQRVLGWEIFHCLCYLWSCLVRNYQTRVVAVKED